MKAIRISFVSLFILTLINGYAISMDSSGGKNSWSVSFADELEDLFHDSNISKKPTTNYTIDVPRGGIAAVHILINNYKEKMQLDFSLLHNGTPYTEAFWYKLIDVPVKNNTGLKNRLGEDNPYIIRKAPFRVFDAIEPVNSPVETTATTMVLRLEIPIEISEDPGLRQYKIMLKAGKQSRELNFNILVYKSILPEVGKSSFPFTNWISFDNIAESHNLEIWSEEYWLMIKKYAQLMVRSRQNSFKLPDYRHLFILDDKDRYNLNRERLRSLVKIFTEAGMYYIEGCHLGSRTGGEWSSKTFSIFHKDGSLATTGEGDIYLAHICRQLMEEIEINGWKDRWLQHVADEPIASNAVDYRIFTGMVHKYMPGIDIIDAVMDTELVGSVNIWCPLAHEYDQHHELFDAFRSRGDKIWFYTCLQPRGPYLNRLMDMERIRPALMGWVAALYNLDGFLHWGLNWWRMGHENKFRLDPFMGSVNYMDYGAPVPPGDSHVFYPGHEGPWSSVRMEAHRIGFEDYELLKMLKTKDPDRAGEIIKKVIRSFTDYTKDPAVYRAARKELLMALDSSAE